MTSDEEEQSRRRQIYRPSASVIIAAKNDNGSKEHNYNYKLLMFKRTVRTQYAPDHYVFPGGVFEEHADESAAWLQHFHDFGITQQELQKLILVNVKRPHPLLTDGKNFARDISLRIAAIRETFEEVGILLCHNRQTYAQRQHTDCGHYYENFDRGHWQELVHNDPYKFLQLCQTLDVVPDLWSLYEWSVWRTPSTASRKFDTALYFVALETQPNLLLERSEVESEMWHSPVLFLRKFTQSLLWLPPLQYYELSRLSNVYDWTELMRFARKRNSKGSTLLMPVYYRCDEGLIGALPGDDFYPSDPMLVTETIPISSGMLEFQQLAKRLHRVEMRDMYDINIALSITPIDEHLSPVKAPAISGKL